MKKSITLGIIRHILTTLGGAVVAKGFADGEDVMAIVGALVTIAGAAWSIYEKRRTRATPLESHAASSKTGGSLNSLLLFLGVLGVLAVATPGCRHAQLEEGGAYARHEPGTIGAETDYALYLADSAYDLAYSSLDAAFRFERDNRELLWKISPRIKGALDALRAPAWRVNGLYHDARFNYLGSPTVENLTTLQGALGQMQSLAADAQSVIATKGTSANE